MEEYVAGLRARAGEALQMEYQHVLMVNRDPVLLDLARALLQEERYNVTTTNAVPLTFALIAAARPALLIIDLNLTEQSGWDLLIRLHQEALTAAIPVVVTARDARLLAHAHRYPDLFGAQSYLAIPFSVDALLGHVRARIGGSETTQDPAER